MKLKLIIMILLISCLSGILLSCDDVSDVDNVRMVVGSAVESHMMEARIIDFVSLNGVVVEVTKTDAEELFLNGEQIYVYVGDYDYYDKKEDVSIASLGYEKEDIPEGMLIDIGDTVKIEYYWSGLEAHKIVRTDGMKTLSKGVVKKYIDTSGLEKKAEPHTDRSYSYAEVVITEIRSKETGFGKELVAEVVQDYGENASEGDRVLINYDSHSLHSIDCFFRNPDVASSISLEPGEELDETHADYELKVGDKVIVKYGVVTSKEGLKYFRLCHIIKFVF